MKTAAELAREVDYLKARIQQIEKAVGDLTSVKVSIEHANPGDVLEDGSVVVTNGGNMALIAGPAFAEVECPWSKQFSEVFDKLSANGFIPSQWFIPSTGQLKIAFCNQEVKKHFSTATHYWSSEEATSNFAKSFNFSENVGFVCSHLKGSSYLSRPFRLLTY